MPTDIDTATAAEAAVPDRSTVTPAGERRARLIDGVRLRRAVTHPDARGTLTEIYDPRWGFMDEPLVYVYMATVRPGMTKGWVVHERQDDRLCFLMGTLRLVLFDDREGSPTHGQVDELFFDDATRGLVSIPAGVFHAVTNVGSVDGMFVNCPTQPYDHDRPDKRRLPADTDLIPYRL